MDSLNALHGTLALLREFVLDAPTPMRKLTMTRNELGRVLRWGHASHPLYVIHNCLQVSCVTVDITYLNKKSNPVLKAMY